mmetsp:Transcript_19282/g.21843  ORF Transcript_19282/g.21843 Transcript_19282/m.21843 type:complete len:433 (-) Transcript_19282:327-1625(-)
MDDLRDQENENDQVLWQRIFDLQIPLDERMVILRSTNFSSIDHDLRYRLWLHLIPADFTFKIFEKYARVKEIVSISEPDNEMKERIEKDLKGLPKKKENFSFLNQRSNLERARDILTIYQRMNDDLDYFPEMSNLVPFLMKIFSHDDEIILIMSHVHRNIIPFTIMKRSEKKRSHRRIFRELIEKCKEKNTRLYELLKIRDNDIIFVNIIKQIAIVWILSLFTTLVDNTRTLFMLWDAIFIYGYTFIEKFTLRLLVEIESKLHENIKNMQIVDKLLQANVKLEDVAVTVNITGSNINMKPERMESLIEALRERCVEIAESECQLIDSEHDSMWKHLKSIASSQNTEEEEEDAVPFIGDENNNPFLSATATTALANFSQKKKGNKSVDWVSASTSVSSLSSSRNRSINHSRKSSNHHHHDSDLLREVALFNDQ